ncbi:hypothetical protein CBQ28_00350 [Pseudoalteromonas sp. GCY]|uniref:hypothetical protein n=1 Tax=Pseudoalteromonas sp. GCY TaxID=2003316 RepID=UPI000BFEE47C|nr:hypothetical protein [Pseudoalteromonas sp. GCY]PHI39003.1 hypothetical protein CBQ28_00350 [Pseudoalteromonas sp. GCY]QQQ65266.1 hypothetical protein JJQ94_01355 [Pseudoalteromonas sp. GCY]
MKRFSVIASSIIIASLVGCSTESTQSDVVKTEGIWADIRVTSNGEGSRVVTEFNLNSSSGANVILSDGDSVRATLGNERKILVKDSDLFDVDYQGYFTATAKNSELTLEFIRDKENEKLTSRVKLPAPIKLYSPVSERFNRNDNILVEWREESDINTKLFLEFKSFCTKTTGDSSLISFESEILESGGQYKILLSELTGFDDDALDKTKPCDTTVTLFRTRKGAIDPKFKSGSRINAIQEKQSEKFQITLN